MVAFYRLKTSPDSQYYKRASDVSFSAVNEGLIETTTSHGITHIAHAKGIFKPSLWLIITLALIACWLFNSYSLIALFLGYPVTVNVDITTKRELVFPAVTVCNMNAIRSSMIDTQITATLSGDVDTSVPDPRAGGNTRKGLATRKSDRRSKSDSVLEYVSRLSLARRKAIGHQREDFILHCEYAGYECDMTAFNQLYNWYYGNCYSMNIGHSEDVELKTAHSTGPSNALKLILNIEQDEYLGELTEKAGVRVIVHPQHQMPFPEENGIAAAPGHSTAIAVRQTTLSRLGGKHGACTNTTQNHININVFEEHYPWTKYSLAACQKTCFQRHLIQQCQCRSVMYPSTGVALGSHAEIPVCDSVKEEHVNCVDSVTLSYNDGTLQCNCTKPCTDTYFSMATSSVNWPAKRYKSTLQAQLSKGSQRIQELISNQEFRDNIVQIEVYFEELNYEELTEIASIDLIQLLSDLGGAVGLWLGASILTCFEFLEYFGDLFVLLFAKCGADKRVHSPT